MKLKIKKPKIGKINFSAKHLYILAWLMLIGTSTYLGFFLYKNFYQTVAQTEEIVLLRQEVAPDTIDTQKIDNVLYQLNEKANSTTTPDHSAIPNPFSPSPIAATDIIE